MLRSLPPCGGHPIIIKARAYIAWPLVQPCFRAHTCRTTNALPVFYFCFDRFYLRVISSLSCTETGSRNGVTCLSISGPTRPSNVSKVLGGILSKLKNEADYSQHSARNDGDYLLSEIDFIPCTKAGKQCVCACPSVSLYLQSG